MIDKESPRKIYLQKNGRYAIYYRKSDGYRKLIIALGVDKLTIVTFMDLPELPRVKIKNE